MRNIPHMLQVFEHLAPVGSTVCEDLGGATLLEEVGFETLPHLQFHSLPLHTEVMHACLSAPLPPCQQGPSLLSCKPNKSFLL